MSVPTVPSSAAPTGAALLGVRSAAAVRIAREARERRERERAARDAGRVTITAADTARGRTPVPPGVRDALAQDKRQAPRMPERVASPESLYPLAAQGGPMLVPTRSHGNAFAAPSVGVARLADAGPVIVREHPESVVPVPVAFTPEEIAWLRYGVPRDKWQAPATRDPWCHGCGRRHAPVSAPHRMATVR